MFNLRNLLISLFSPAAIFIAVMVVDIVFKTGVLNFFIIMIYLQHVYFGELFGVNLHGNSSAWVPLPYNGNFMLFNLLLDYLLVALVIYILLTALSECFFRSKFAST